VLSLDRDPDDVAGAVVDHTHRRRRKPARRALFLRRRADLRAGVVDTLEAETLARCGGLGPVQQLSVVLPLRGDVLDQQRQ